MKKIVYVIIITILLFSVVIAEQIFVDQTLNSLDDKIDSISTKIARTEIIDNEDIATNCNEIDIFWTEREKILCLFINHNDLNKIGEQIKKIKVYVEQNNKENCKYELETLKFYAESYRHVFEINFQNLF